MKKLLMLCFLLSGCSFESDIVSVDESVLKFKAGEHILTTQAFYSNCEGTIMGYNTFRRKKNGTTYLVHFYCPNIGWLDGTVFLDETTLIPKKDD